MKDRPRKATEGYARYGIPLVLVGLALGVTLALYPLVLVSPLFFAAVILSAWLGGTGPGLFAVVLAAFGIDYFFLEPRYRVGLGVQQLFNIVGFVVSAGVVSWLASARQRAEASLRRAYDTVEATVHERTAHLRRTTELLQAEIAEREEAQRALGDTQSALAHMARVTAMGELAATIAHEVNQPLAAIAANGSACLRWLDGDQPEVGEARTAAQRIVRDAHRASEVVARIRSLVNRAPYERGPLSLSDVVRDVVPLLLPLAERSGARLLLDLRDGFPQISGDRIQLQQVVLNLAMNGLEAMRGVIGKRELAMRTTMDDGWIALSVADTGIGIDPQHAQHVFDAFHSTKQAGMGMGLSVCKTIVEAHGGAIRFEPNAGGAGVTFRVLLPVARAAS